MLMLSLLAAPVSGAATGKKSSAKPTHKTTAANKKGSKTSAKAKKGAWRRRGQQGIDNSRTMEIQTALIRAGYLSGEPTGVMDASTKAALVKLQQENGWQTKIVPDSRALIKLGLGPNRDDLLNPKTAEYSTAADVKGGGGSDNGRPKR